MPYLVLDSGAVTWLAAPSRASAALIHEFKEAGLWPALVPAAVLIECLTGMAGRDASVNRLVKTCEVGERLPVALARRAAALRTAARRGSAIDALVVASAEPEGVVLTGDPDDLRALAAGDRGVVVRAV